MFFNLFKDLMGLIKLRLNLSQFPMQVRDLASGVRQLDLKYRPILIRELIGSGVQRFVRKRCERLR
jgi:hypothetical protein